MRRAFINNDLRRAVARAGISSQCAETETPAAIELRLARPDEAHLTRRLAALDDARPLEGQILLALSDGVAVAALSLDDGRVVADPFVCTGGVVALLRLRTELITGVHAPRRRWLGSLTARAAA